MAKGVKTGGRVRGVKNKATVEKEAVWAQQVEESKARGITPLEVMLETMREHWEGGRKSDACAIAKDAAPYMHGRIQTIEGGDHNKPIRTVGELVWLDSSASE
jgi:hypothetical protein